MKFKVDSLTSLEDVARTNVQSENYQRAMTQKLRVAERFCSEILNKLCYNCKKYEVDIFYSLEDMAQTKILSEK